MSLPQKDDLNNVDKGGISPNDLSETLPPPSPKTTKSALKPPTEEQRIAAKAVLQQFCRIGLEYIESCQNTIGTMLANQERDAASAMLAHLHGYVLALSHDEAFAAVIEEKYVSRDLYETFHWWVDTLLESSSKINDLSKTSSLTVGQDIDILVDLSQQCRVKLNELISRERQRKTSWLTPQVEADLFKYFEAFSTQASFGDATGIVALKMPRLCRRVLSLLEPSVLSEIEVFKSLASEAMGSEFFAGGRLTQAAQWWKGKGAAPAA